MVTKQEGNNFSFPYDNQDTGGTESNIVFMGCDMDNSVLLGKIQEKKNHSFRN